MNTDGRLMCPSWVATPIKNSEGNLIGMNPIRYDQFVLRLFKKMEFEQMVTHAVLGITSEAGEIANCYKKVQAYGQEINLKNLIEELGDMRFFLQAIQNLYGISDGQILQANAEKLAERYSNLEYSDSKAAARKDKTSGDTE